MDGHDIRRENLQILIDRKYAGVRARFAEAMNWHRQRVSSLLSVKAPKGMGYVAARQIEQVTGMPAGWMDIPKSGRGSMPESGDSVAGGQGSPVPLIALRDVPKWLAGDLSIVQRWVGISLPSSGVQSYLVLEPSAQMFPIKAGDAYFVDPERMPSYQDVAVFDAGAEVVVGVYTKGLAGDRVTHAVGDEFVTVSNSACLGVVMATFTSSVIEELLCKRCVMP